MSAVRMLVEYERGGRLLCTVTGKEVPGYRGERLDEACPGHDHYETLSDAIDGGLRFAPGPTPEQREAVARRSRDAAPEMLALLREFDDPRARRLIEHIEASS